MKRSSPRTWLASSIGSATGQPGLPGRGEEVIEKAGRLRPDLVLMDIQLDGQCDGIVAAEAIRNQYDLPVIYLTAHSDATTLARAKLTGPFGYILKPFDERDLAVQIERALYKHQAERKLREQREWLRVTLNSIGDAVIATDAIWGKAPHTERKRYYARDSRAWWPATGRRVQSHEPQPRAKRQPV